jgi:hypothetical protein
MPTLSHDSENNMETKTFILSSRSFNRQVPLQNICPLLIYSISFLCSSVKTGIFMLRMPSLQSSAEKNPLDLALAV